MKVFHENLYENIFSKRAADYTHLRIISGYSSAEFLSRFIKDFPYLTIELFIGMTFQGISKLDHHEYNNLMQGSKNINIYYQVLGIQNHMKVFEFSNILNTKTFIGSANFSKNGFLVQKEILAEIENLPEEVFIEQKNNSLLCTESGIEKYVEFYDNENKTLNMPEQSEVFEEAKGTVALYDLAHKKNKEAAKRRWELLKGKMDPRYYQSFEVTIILPPENNSRWADKGINSWVNEKPPVIEQTPRLSFSKVFPKENFTIYTDDNEVWNARLTGNFNGNLEIQNRNLYDYISKRIGLMEKRPISHYDLSSAGYSTLYFTRVNYKIFVMSFHEEDKLFLRAEEFNVKDY